MGNYGMEHLLPTRIAACGGRELNRKLHGRLVSPDLEQATIVVYRYHDFDFSNSRTSPRSRTGLINTLCRAAQRGVGITFVTRDPLTELSSNGLRDRTAHLWYRGLKRLSEFDGVKVLIHRSLHAKVYLVRSTANRVFYAVGSSNLTYQGMGFKWTECNVLGYSISEYLEVEKEVMRIVGDSEISNLQQWARKAARAPAGLSFLKSGREPS